jgi:ATP-dependent DNA helicase RecG
MLTLEELHQGIRLGEDSRLEFKAVRFQGAKLVEPKRDVLADELVAMANTVGGTILLGVEDRTREVPGIPLELLDEVERAVFQLCQDSVTPPLLYRSYRREVSDGHGGTRALLEIEVPRSLFVHRGPGGYLHRQGSSKRELAPEALARLFQQRSQARLIRFDEQGVPETSIETLSSALFERFLPPGREPVAPKLRKLKLLTSTEQGTEVATVGGLLLCSRTPEQWLPGAFVEAVAYGGKTPDSRLQIDARRVTGPLDQQILDAMHFVRRNMWVAATKAPGRIDLPQFSLRAVFEAVVNAVAHRDYSISGSKIRLFVFEDRLELYSPGALPNTLTVDSLELRQSTRNELLASLLGKLKVSGVSDDIDGQTFLEKRGEGVPIILEESRRNSGRLPEYRLIDDAELLLTLYARARP